MVGYATIYTMAPVFSLVLDRDVNEDLALLYPELYKELTKVGSASLVNVMFLTLVSYQGTSFVFQDVLSMAYDKSLPRRALFCSMGISI